MSVSFDTLFLLNKMKECEQSHRENGDDTGADAILNAIQYALQECGDIMSTKIDLAKVLAR